MVIYTTRTALFLTLIAAFFSLESCIERAKNTAPAVTAAVEPALPAPSDNYWYQGKAEISAFEVEQERYGEQRKAGQVMVFVTEDFSAQKQVKLDDKPGPDDRAVSVLKLNTVRRFQTGIYDYSLMQSTFMPMEAAAVRSLKTTTSIQDWCGHVFVQGNQLDNGEYKIGMFSYFESEGDQSVRLRPDLLEDDLWLLLRLNPDALAGREAAVLPGAFYTRFRHKPMQTEKARIDVEKGAKESVLRLAYQSIPRQLDIRFETAFPHRILGWEERYEGKMMSKGRLKNTLMDAYWQHHDLASAPLRAELNPGW